MAPLGHWARPSESKTVDQKSTKWIPWVSQRSTSKAAHGPQDHFTSKWFLKRDTIPFGMRWLSVGFFAAGKLLSTVTRRVGGTLFLGVVGTATSSLDVVSSSWCCADGSCGERGAVDDRDSNRRRSSKAARFGCCGGAKYSSSTQTSTSTHRRHTVTSPSSFLDSLSSSLG